MLSPWLSCLLALLFSYFGTGLLRRYALNNQLLDHPNARSSHQQATPRGGGVAFAVAFLLLLPLLYLQHQLPRALLYALWGSGALVALIGFADDHRSLPAHWRLAGHATASVWALHWLNGLPLLHFGSFSLELGLYGWLIGLLGLIWLLNLYNFMDGIDGIASLQAITVAIGALACSFAVGIDDFLLPLLLATAVAGFLPWNFPKSRIFMGDAGSGFLGITLGILMLSAAQQQPLMLWGWLILLGVFIVDASWTLLRRLCRGENLAQAHRSHAYQKWALSCRSHARVSLSVGAVNLIWLLPLAWLAVTGSVNPIAALVIAYAPILIAVICLGAGTAEGR